MVDRAPALLLCAHGTRDRAGQAVVRRIAHRLGRARPGLEVIRGYVDVQSPHLSDLTTALSACDRRFVVVPLLLSAGHHVLVDIPAALGHPGAVAAAPLGPDPALADLLVRRLREAGARDGDAVVLAAAGSSRSEAADDAQRAVQQLRRRWPGAVQVGYGSAAGPTVTQSVARLRAVYPRVAVASYLIGRGHFHTRLRDCGADLVTAPLGADESLVRLLLQRYDAARSRSAALSSPAIPTVTSTISSA